MPGDVDTQTPPENQVDTQDQDLDEDFDAGFNEPTEGKPAAKPEDDDKSPADDPAQADAPAQTQPEDETVTVSKKEWERVLAAVASVDRISEQFSRQSTTALGKIGSLEQRLAQLQQSTPTGQSVEISEDDFAELKADFPELADRTFKAMQRVVGRFKGTGGAQAPDPEAITKLVRETRAAEREVEEREALEEDHPNWREIVGNPDDKDNEFRKWLSGQSESFRKRVENSRRASVASDAISKFLDHKAAADKAAEKQREADEAARKEKDSRARRFEAAATPKAAGGHAKGKSEDDEFEEGFNS